MKDYSVLVFCFNDHSEIDFLLSAHTPYPISFVHIKAFNSLHTNSAAEYLSNLDKSSDKK